MFNTLRPRQDGRHFPDDIFKSIFVNKNVWISFEISLKFILKCPINNIPTLVQIMAWRRPGDKPLSEPMMVSLPMHICVTRPQWVYKTASGHCPTKTDEDTCIHLLLLKDFLLGLNIVMKTLVLSNRALLPLMHIFQHGVNITDANARELIKLFELLRK